MEGAAPTTRPGGTGIPDWSNIMTRTQAFKSASGAVSIHGARTSWTIYYPYYDAQLDGPSGSSSADGYAKAMHRSRVIKARIAGALLGLEGEALTDLQYEVDCNGADWQQAVRNALAGI